MATEQLAVPVRQPLVATAGWWLLTLATLVVLDDLTFGPVFWAAARLFGQSPAVALAFGVYVTVQILLVRQGTADNPHRVARWFLGRLALQRRHDGVAMREKALHERAASVGGAILVTPIVGGVIPPLALTKYGASTQFARRLSYVTAPIYAAEFAFLHGWIPGAI